MSYRNQWKEWFDGGNTIWSEYGYNYHSYKIVSEILPTLDIPTNADIIQFGCGVGVSIEKLCELYGYDRVYGYDIFNPLNHPRIFSFDAYKEEPPKTNIAYCDIDIGSVATDKNIRYDLFSYAWDYLIPGGYILINNSVVDEYKKRHPLSIQNSQIKKLNEFDNKELWKSPHQNRLNTKTLVRKL